MRQRERSLFFETAELLYHLIARLTARFFRSIYAASRYLACDCLIVFGANMLKSFGVEVEADFNISALARTMSKLVQLPAVYLLQAAVFKLGIFFRQMKERPCGRKSAAEESLPHNDIIAQKEIDEWRALSRLPDSGARPKALLIGSQYANAR